MESKITSHNSIIFDQTYVMQEERGPHDTCKEHGKPFVVFCKPCHMACCAVCIANKHDRHSFMTIEDAAKHARSRLENFIKKQETTTLQKLEIAQKALEESLNKYETSIQTTKAKSKERFAALQQEFAKIENEWNHRFENMEAEDTSEIRQLKELMDDQLKSVKRNIDTCKSKHCAESDLEVLLFSFEIKDDASSITTVIPKVPLVSFEQSNYKLPEMNMLIGELKYEPRGKTSSHTSSPHNSWKTWVKFCCIGIVLLFVQCISLMPFIYIGYFCYVALSAYSAM